MPTLVIAVIVDGRGETELRLFSPLVLKDYLDRTGGTGFSLPVTRGEVIEPNELFQHVSHWALKGRYYVADAVGFTWPPKDADLWESVTRMISQLTLIHERAFSPPLTADDQRSLPDTVEQLVNAYLEGAGLSEFDLSSRPSEKAPTHLEAVQIEAIEAVDGARSEKNGWSDWVEPLSSVSASSNKQDSLHDLAEICRSYGIASRNRVKPPV